MSILNTVLSKKLRDALILLLILGGVVFVWYYISNWIDSHITAGTILEQQIAAVRGQFGDKFGAVNALFSGLAFAGIIITLLLQRRDLAETRKAMGHERFDNTFFQLLNLHINITSKLAVKGRHGIEAFESFAEHMKTCDPDFYAFSALQKISRDKVRTIIDTKTIPTQAYPELTPADITNLSQYLAQGVRAFQNYLDDSVVMHEEKVVSAYKKSAEEHIDYFSHYFRNLYHILKFIDESTLIGDDEKCMYSKFVRSQLSDIELVCIFYNSISRIELPGREKIELGYPKMQVFLKKYDILQNMNPRSLIHPIHKEIFDKNKGE